MQKKRSLPKMFFSVTQNVLLGLIICFVMVLALFFLLDMTWGVVLVQLLCTAASGGLLYSAMWIEGDKEKNFVQFGRMEEDKHWGLKTGLVGMLLPMATMLLLVFAKILDLPNLVFIYKVINPQIGMLVNLIIPTINPASVGVLQFLLIALLYLYIPFFCAVGYQLGYRRISLAEKLIYAKKEDGDKKLGQNKKH